MLEIKEKIKESLDDVATQPIAEGSLTKMVENQTAKIPSMFFLNLALGSILASATLKLIGSKKDTSSFVGLWAPTFLLLGIYNKLVKIEGNDRYSRTRPA